MEGNDQLWVYMYKYFNSMDKNKTTIISMGSFFKKNLLALVFSTIFK